MVALSPEVRASMHRWQSLPTQSMQLDPAEVVALDTVAPVTTAEGDSMAQHGGAGGGASPGCRRDVQGRTYPLELYILSCS